MKPTPLDYQEARTLFSRYRMVNNVRFGWFGRIIICVIDFINGVWSDFPICCVWYFTKLSYGTVHPNSVYAFLECVHNQEDYMYWLGQSGYVCCPACFRARYHIPLGKIRKGGISPGLFHKRIKVCDDE